MDVSDDHLSDVFDTIDTKNEPKLMTQYELNDLTRDLCLSKESAQLLGSRLKDNNLLAPETTFYWYREREKDFRQYFSINQNKSLVYCKNITGLVEAMGLEYQATDWRLFIDASMRSLKAVLLYKGNSVASIPVGHSVQLKENYANIKLLLVSLNYNDHKWLICGDLKVNLTNTQLTNFL